MKFWTVIIIFKVKNPHINGHKTCTDNSVWELVTTECFPNYTPFTSIWRFTPNGENLFSWLKSMAPLWRKTDGLLVFGRLGLNVSKTSIKIQTSSHVDSQNISIVLCTGYMAMFNFTTVSDLQKTPNDGPVDRYSFCWDNASVSSESKHQGFHKNKFWWWPWRSMLKNASPLPT